MFLDWVGDLKKKHEIRASPKQRLFREDNGVVRERALG